MTRSPALALYRKQRRRRMQPEAALQITIAEHLRVAPTPGTWFLRIPNGGKRSVYAAAQSIRMGELPGAWDLLIFVPDMPPLWLECKSPIGRLSPEQVAFGEMLDDSQHNRAVVSDIGIALKTLRQYGALKPEARLRRAA